MFNVRINDIITIKEKTVSKNIVQENLKRFNNFERPTYLKFDSKKLEGQVINYCDRNDLLLDLNELLVIEYYSRR